MKKVNIKVVIMAITSLVLITLGIVVYAAFNYKKIVESPDTTIGDITINSKTYISYALKDTDDYSSVEYSDTQEYYRLSKLRTDSIAYVEGISVNSTYLQVSIPGFTTGVTYYTYNSATGAYSVASSYSSSETYYTRKDSLVVKSAYDATNTLLDVTISNNIITLKKNNVTVETLTLTIENNLISSVLLADSNHRYVIGSDKSSVYIFTKNVGTYEIASTNDTITCYASERKKNDNRIHYEYPYLNQLGLKFEFTVKIPVYVRIHIQDAWISTQFLSSKSERTRYISKDQISGSSPFSITDDDWYYDAQNNIAYLRTMFTPVVNDGMFSSQSYTFNVNEGYFYHDTSAQAASKVTTVQVSFTVDIVQANRAEALWGVDFDELFN